MEVSQEQFRTLVEKIKEYLPELNQTATQRFSAEFYMRDVEVHLTHKVQTGSNEYSFEFLPSGEVKKGKFLLLSENGVTILILYPDGTMSWELTKEIKILPKE